MASLIPIPSTRTSDLLLAQRMLGQLQQDQRDLLRVQTQLSTGLRITAPSEDPLSALRAISLQRLVEQKDQVATNLSASQSFVTATDSALSGVHGLLAEIRGSVLSVANTTSTDTQREAVAAETLQAIQQLIDVGNQQFRGRYLFGGSDANAAPFDSISGGYVRYSGNEDHLRSYSDLELLLATNATGNEVFGAISAERLGDVDLNPVLTENTRLADLNGGLGVSEGSIAVSDGTTTSIVDLSTAETLGDVVQLIEANPPNGRTLVVRIAPAGLKVEIDQAPQTNLTIREVNGGTTASELGVFESSGTLNDPIVGRDLNPRLRLTTRLSDILGSRSFAALQSAGADDDLVIHARENGAGNNGATLQLVDDALLQAGNGLQAGNEFVTFSGATPQAARAALTFSGAGNNLVLTAAAPGTGMNNIAVELVDAGAIGNAAVVNFDAGAGRLTIGVDSANATTVDAVIQAVNAEGTFSAAYDAADPLDGGLNPAAIVASGDVGVVAGNTGNSGAAADTYLVHVEPGQTTANDVIAALETFAPFDDRFLVALDGKDESASANAGRGKIDVDATAVTADGSGGELDLASGLQILNGGQTHLIDFQGAETVEDLLNVLNGSSANVVADINAQGTGIDIRSRLSGADFSIAENGGQTATQLGLRTLTRDTLLSSLNHGRGVETNDADAQTDFTIRTRAGQQLEINVTGAATIGDVLDLINNHPDNLNPATAVVAQLTAVGNGIELVDANAAGADTLEIEQHTLSHAAWDLGLIDAGERIAQGGGTPETIGGTDTATVQTDGVFNTLLRIHEALLDNDFPALQQAMTGIDDDLERLSFIRAEMGSRGQDLDVMTSRVQDENIRLQQALSEEIDVDLAEAISNLTTRQAVFEAALQAMARTFALSLVDFL